jgi:hypothetical protein
MLAGCGPPTVVVGPSSNPPPQDNFFATWEISSSFYGSVSCPSVGASFVDMDLVNVDTGRRFLYSFDCNAYQGTSGPVDVGRFDVLLNLSDAGHGVISSIDVGTSNASVAGTIDLGHFVFTVQ